MPTGEIERPDWWPEDEPGARPLLPQAAAAARWWADILRRPVITHDNGGPVASALLTANAAFQERPTPEQIAWFEQYLADRLTSWCRRVWPYPVVLRVDYEPQEFLRTAAELAGFNPDRLLPVKTDMVITPQRVSMSVGYGSPERIIWRENASRRHRRWV